MKNMFKFVKDKIAKRSKTRGITFSDKDLLEVGAKFEYIVDMKNQKLVILQSETAKGEKLDWEEKAKNLNLNPDEARSGTVSRKGKKQLPLIDIRSKIANGVFGDADLLRINIYNDTVVVEGYEDNSKEEETKNVVTNLADKIVSKFSNNNVVSFKDFIKGKAKKKFEFSMSKKELQQAVGEQLSFESFFSDVLEVEPLSSSMSSSSAEIIKEALQQAHIPLQVASFFSGAGLMDEGFKEAGFDIVFALEKDPEAAQTYIYNHGDHMLVGDITDFDMTLMKNAPVVIGGPPCQGHSAANRKTNFLDNPNNALLKSYIDVIKANQNCQVFVIENVPQILTAGDGLFKDEIIKELSDFEISYGVLSSADYGCAQDRSRAIFIGSKIGKIELPTPTHTKENYATVKEALDGLSDDLPNQLDYSKPKADTLERMKYVKQGENWQAIPDELKTPRMMSGNTHSSVYRRLREDKPSITIANPRKSNILNPWVNRILSIRECARLFGLQDDFVFLGSLSSKQQQVANGVPVQLAKAIATQIKNIVKMFNVRNRTETFGTV